MTEDYFAKWLEAIPNQEAKTVGQKILEEMFLHFSLPDKLHSDLGRQFEGKLIEELCKLLQVEKLHTTPYHPQGDGLVESKLNNFRYVGNSGGKSQGLGISFESDMHSV